MELKRDGFAVQVNPAEQSNEWLIGAAREIADAAKERGLDLPFVTGVVAVEAANISEVLTSTKESFAEQLGSASRGCNAVIDSLNSGRRRNRLTSISVETVEREFDSWLTAEKLAHVAAAQEADPEVHFTLVATPNVLVNDKDLAKAAKAFGQNQPHETYYWESLYSLYTPEELSGTNPSNGNRVVFSLIPSKYTPGMYGAAYDKIRKLDELRATFPDAKIPSPLEAVAFWQTLRVQGDLLADNTTYDRTYISHFDLEQWPVDGDWIMPCSLVNNDGKPFLNLSYALASYDTRVAVG